MRYLKQFVLMIQFLTTIPIRINLDVKEEDFGKGLVFAPFVGLLLGGVLAAFYYAVKDVFPDPVTAVLLVVVYILLTGGLHLDGLGDTFDGLFSNRSRERMLEIMRDSRVGTNAVLALVCVLLLNVSLLQAIPPAYKMYTLLFMPVAGRIGSLVGAGASKYARSGEGLGRSFIDFCGIKEIIAGLAAYFLVFALVWGRSGLMAAVLPPVTAFLTVKFFGRKIGGATGDTLGAVCELNQTLFLITVYILIQAGVMG